MHLMGRFFLSASSIISVQSPFASSLSSLNKQTLARRKPNIQNIRIKILMNTYFSILQLFILKLSPLVLSIKTDPPMFTIKPYKICKWHLKIARETYPQNTKLEGLELCQQWNCVDNSPLFFIWTPRSNCTTRLRSVDCTSRSSFLYTMRKSSFCVFVDS